MELSFICTSKNYINLLKKEKLKPDIQDFRMV